MDRISRGAKGKKLQRTLSYTLVTTYPGRWEAGAKPLMVTEEPGSQLCGSGRRKTGLLEVPRAGTAKIVYSQSPGEGGLEDPGVNTNAGLVRA